MKSVFINLSIPGKISRGVCRRRFANAYVNTNRIEFSFFSLSLVIEDNLYASKKIFFQLWKRKEIYSLDPLIFSYLLELYGRNKLILDKNLRDLILENYSSFSFIEFRKKCNWSNRKYIKRKYIFSFSIELSEKNIVSWESCLDLWSFRPVIRFQFNLSLNN